MPSNTTSALPVPDRPRRVRTLPLRYRPVSPLVLNYTTITLPTTPQGSLLKFQDGTIQGHYGNPTQIPRAEERAHGKRLLQEDMEDEDSKLKDRIRRLERSEKRLKARLAERDDESANKDAELGETRQALHLAEERLSEKEEEIRGLIREVHHYQGWWLNEHYFLKATLTLVPKRDQNDAGVKAMKESSNACFMKWSGSHHP